MAASRSLDRPLASTFFKSIFAKSKKDSTVTLNDLADMIEDTVAPSKDKLPWIKLGTFGELKTDKGSYRNNDNLLSIDGVEVDYDAEDMTPKEAAKRLREADIAGVVYTSASHTPEAPRWRVLLPCSNTLEPDERAKLVARVNGILDGDLDGVSFTKSQSFYYGCVEGKEDNHKVYRIEGRFIDDAADLDAGARGKRQKDKPDGDSSEYEKDETGSGAAFRKAVSLQLAGAEIEEFEEWAAENQWRDYEANSQRAVERTWSRAGVEAGRIALAERALDPVEFEDVSGGEDDGEEPADKPAKKARVPLFLMPLADETLDTIPPLVMLFQNHMSRGWLTGLMAPGGAGKSALSVNEAISMASGIDFLAPRIEADFEDEDDVIGGRPLFQMFQTFEPLRVGVFNFEDDNDTMRRRFAAAREYHGITHKQLGGRLFFSGAEQQANFSQTEQGRVKFTKKTWQEIRKIIETLKLDVLNFDPFVSTHHGDENSNGEMAEVWGKFRELCNEYQIAIQIAHHTRKGSPGVDLTAESARGASAINGVIRFSRVINRMQPEDAEKLGITNHWAYIRVDDGKANHTPPSEKANWRTLVSVENEHHAVSTVAVERWEYPKESVEDAAEKPAKEKKDAESSITIDQTMEALWAYARETGKKTFGQKDFVRATEKVLGMHDKFRRSYIKKLLRSLDCIESAGPGIFRIIEAEPKVEPPDGDDVI